MGDSVAQRGTVLYVRHQFPQPSTHDGSTTASIGNPLMASTPRGASSTQNAVARNLRIRLAAVKLSGSALANLLGVQPDWVYRRTAEEPATDISIRDLERMAPHLQTTVAALVTGDES